MTKIHGRAGGSEPALAGNTFASSEKRDKHQINHPSPVGFEATPGAQVTVTTGDENQQGTHQGRGLDDQITAVTAGT